MFDELMAARSKGDGPWFIAVRIDDKPGVGATDRDPVLITDLLHARDGDEGADNFSARPRESETGKQRKNWIPAFAEDEQILLR